MHTVYPSFYPRYTVNLVINFGQDVGCQSLMHLKYGAWTFQRSEFNDQSSHVYQSMSRTQNLKSVLSAMFS